MRMTRYRFHPEFPLSPSSPTQIKRPTASDCNCQPGLQLTGFPRTTQAVSFQSPKIAKARNRPSFDPYLRHLFPPRLPVAEIRSVGGSPTLLAWAATPSAVPWPRRVADSNDFLPAAASS